MALLGEGHELIAEATHTRPDTHCQCNTTHSNSTQGVSLQSRSHNSRAPALVVLGWAGLGEAGLLTVRQLRVVLIVRNDLRRRLLIQRPRIEHPTV